jgi:hypothetical protein
MNIPTSLHLCSARPKHPQDQCQRKRDYLPLSITISSLSKYYKQVLSRNEMMLPRNRKSLLQPHQDSNHGRIKTSLFRIPLTSCSLLLLLLAHWIPTAESFCTTNTATAITGRRNLLLSSPPGCVDYCHYSSSSSLCRGTTSGCCSVLRIQSKRKGRVGVTASTSIFPSHLAASLKSDEGYDDANQFTKSSSPTSEATTTDNNNNISINVASLESNTATTTTTVAATTNTINERLLAELQEAEQRERFGSRSSLTKNGKRKNNNMSLIDGFGRRRKTDEEVRAAIAEARDLNGVNPLVAIGGSFFAFAVAAVLWLSTNKLGVFFATHPPETDVYFVIRTAQVFRNVMMGLVSLASGFFGVTGLGIFLLGIRVAYGVAVGELDPTPIKKTSSSKDDMGGVDFSNVWDLMMNKKPGRKG